MAVRNEPRIASRPDDAAQGGSSADAPREIRLPEARDRFVRSLGGTLENRCGIRRGARLIAAVSGGADSLALLAGVLTLTQTRHRQYQVTVAHIQHHLRDEAEQEAERVAELCNRLGIQFARRDIEPGVHSGNTSAIARRLRYAALGDIAREHDAECVVTAHHGTDLLESILLNLMRGSGLDGLGGMDWRKDLFGVTVCRPLLNQTRSDCEVLCRSIGWTWVDDPSNDRLDQRRNRIRADVLPPLLELSPDLDRRIHRLAEQSRAARELVDQFVQDRIGDASSSSFPRRAFSNLSEIVLGAALRAIGIAHGAPADSLSTNLLEPLVRAIQDDNGSRRTFEWPDGLRLELTADTLFVRHLNNDDHGNDGQPHT